MLTPEKLKILRDMVNAHLHPKTRWIEFTNFRYENKSQLFVSAKCECGSYKKRIRVDGIKNGKSTSCGCTRFGAGKFKPKEYSAWRSMKLRCLNPRNKSFRLYGARGISVCKRWLNGCEKFLKDMGPCPPDFSLDRIDNNKGYYPENCKWSNAREQAINRRTSIFITYKGRTRNCSEWARIYNIPVSTLRGRHKRAWPLAKVFGETK